MNFLQAIELLAGVLAWLGFLASLPVYGWLLWGLWRWLRSALGNDDKPKIQRSTASTGRRSKRRGSQRDGNARYSDSSNWDTHLRRWGSDPDWNPLATVVVRIAFGVEPPRFLGTGWNP